MNLSVNDDSFCFSLFCSITEVSSLFIFNFTIFSLLPNFFDIIFPVILLMIYSSGVMIPPTTLSPKPKLEVITASS